MSSWIGVAAPRPLPQSPRQIQQHNHEHRLYSTFMLLEAHKVFDVWIWHRCETKHQKDVDDLTSD
eukprot:2132620-Amphidinium_carterae.2